MIDFSKIQGMVQAMISAQNRMIDGANALPSDLFSFISAIANATIPSEDQEIIDNYLNHNNEKTIFNCNITLNFLNRIIGSFNDLNAQLISTTALNLTLQTANDDLSSKYSSVITQVAGDKAAIYTIIQGLQAPLSISEAISQLGALNIMSIDTSNHGNDTNPNSYDGNSDSNTSSVEVPENTTGTTA